MSKTVISVEHLTKRYDLGVIGTGTVSRDLNRWWARMRGQPDPYLKIGQADHGNRQGESILALDDVSFTVEQGEVLGIIGRNGAGKSTLLKILSQVTAPTSGAVKVKGRIGSLLEVGTGFHPELTGRENVYLNGAILGMTRAEVDRKFDEIVDFSGVQKFIDTPVKRYSSGMYVRLAFAVAAHLEPEILIVDEVLAVGDAEFQKKCLGKMGDVAQEGRTVLFVSHNMAAIQRLCEKGILVDRGTLKANGNMAEVIKMYLSASKGYEEEDFFVESPEFKLTRIHIYQEKTNSSTFITQKPLFVQYNYEIRDPKLKRLRIGFDVLSVDGQVIFRTFDDDQIEINSRTQGNHISICTIPGNFFYPGDFYIEPRIGIHNVKWITKAEKRIKVTFDYLGGVNQKYADKRPGLIMPALQWRTTKNV